MAIASGHGKPIHADGRLKRFVTASKNRRRESQYGELALAATEKKPVPTDASDGGEDIFGGLHDKRRLMMRPFVRQEAVLPNKVEALKLPWARS
jgi:hypothetical protein